MFKDTPEGQTHAMCNKRPLKVGPLECCCCSPHSHCEFKKEEKKCDHPEYVHCNTDSCDGVEFYHEKHCAKCGEAIDGKNTTKHTSYCEWLTKESKHHTEDYCKCDCHSPTPKNKEWSGRACLNGNHKTCSYIECKCPCHAPTPDNKECFNCGCREETHPIPECKEFVPPTPDNKKCNCVCHQIRIVKRGESFPRQFDRDYTCEHCSPSWKESFDKKFYSKDDTTCTWHRNFELKLFIADLLSKNNERLIKCQKLVEDGKAICGVRLDCHLHDWRQKDFLEDYKKELVEEIEGMKKPFTPAGFLDTYGEGHLEFNRAIEKIVALIKSKKL